MHPLWLYAGSDRGRGLGRGLISLGSAARDPAIPLSDLEVPPVVPAVVAFPQRHVVTQTLRRIRHPSRNVKAAAALLALASAGGAVTVSPPVAAMSLAGLTPTVRSSSAVVISVPLASMNLAGLAPAVAVSATPQIVGFQRRSVTYRTLPRRPSRLVGPSFLALAGGPVSIGVPIGALNLAGLTPTVLSTANKTVAVPLAGLTLAGLAPTVVAGASQTVNPPVGALTLAGLPPTVAVSTASGDLLVLGARKRPNRAPIRSTTRRTAWAGLTAPVGPVSISVPAAGLTLAGLPPTVSNGAGTTIAVPSGTLQVAGLVPTVARTFDMGVPPGYGYVRDVVRRSRSHGSRNWLLVLAPVGNQTIGVPLANLNLAGLAPSVLNGGAQTINPPVGALTLAGLAPSVVASGNQSVAIPVAALTLAGLQPLVQVGGPQTVSVPLATLTIAGLAPSVMSPRTVNVPLGTMTVSGLAPVVAVTANRSISVPLGTLSLAGLAPGVVLSGNQYVGVPTGNLLVQGLAPFVSAPQTVSVPKAALVMAALVPSFSVTVTGNNTYGPRYILQRIRARLFSVAHNPPRLFTVARARARTWSVNFMAIRVFEDKDPSEKVKLAFDFTIDLPAGVTLTGTPVVVVTTVEGIDGAPTAILNGAAVFDVTNKKIIQPVRDGLDGVTYNVSVWCATTDAQLALELDGDLPVVKRKRP